VRSLRGRLTVWLLAGMGLLLVAGGLLLDRAISSRLGQERDATLIAEAKSLMLATEQEGSRVRLELADGAAPEFEPGKRADYYEIWRADGAVLARSPSLAGRNLPAKRSGAVGQPRLRDFTLPDGRPGRRIEARFRPQIEQPSEEPGEEEEESTLLAPPGTPVLTLAVAQGREDLAAFLASLHLTLALFVAGLLAGMAVLVKGAVGRALSPLDGLARRLEALDADSLGEPVMLADAPSELASTIAHLNGLLARLKGSFERERTFSANLAHELRTPLAELRTITEVALKWPDDAASWPGSLAEIRGIGLQMERMVVNLLALARCDGRQALLVLSQVALRDLAAECWSGVLAEAEDKGTRLALEVPAGLAMTTDRDKLGLILSNLFSNAVAHGTPGGVVTCSAAAAGGGFEIRVANPSTGLTAADLPRLFDRFWRKDAARSDGSHAGLGLSLVAALCELLGLRAEAHLHDGRFEITLHGPPPASFPASQTRSKASSILT
jgi:two-component system, OmpR family, heavy metal sensor histidine kinase CusS